MLIHNSDRMYLTSILDGNDSYAASSVAVGCVIFLSSFVPIFMVLNIGVEITPERALDMWFFCWWALSISALLFCSISLAYFRHRAIGGLRHFKSRYTETFKEKANQNVILRLDSYIVKAKRKWSLIIFLVGILLTWGGAGKAIAFLRETATLPCSEYFIICLLSWALNGALLSIGTVCILSGMDERWMSHRVKTSIERFHPV